MMNHSYNVEHNNTKYNLSLQTDPDLYALKNKKKNTSYKVETTTTSTVSVSNNRLAYVEALVDINAVVIETIWCNHSVIKESRVSPVVPLRTFIQEVLKRSRTTYSTLQTALFYLFRCKATMMNHLQQNNAYISCGRRMFLASLIVASKFVQDKTYRNSAWAKIAGLPVQEINTAERYFLDILDYRLYIEQSIFDRWHKLLHIRTQARIHNIPTTIHDLSCLSFTPKYHQQQQQNHHYHHNHHHHYHHHHHNYPIIQQQQQQQQITTTFIHLLILYPLLLYHYLFQVLFLLHQLKHLLKYLLFVYNKRENMKILIEIIFLY
ncbi:cyclin-domain-containing protein [Pilaira anomala]|nr:cyclin-domain-containing protein [Pilaira anomala]